MGLVPSLTVPVAVFLVVPLAGRDSFTVPLRSHHTKAHSTQTLVAWRQRWQLCSYALLELAWIAICLCLFVFWTLRPLQALPPKPANLPTAATHAGFLAAAGLDTTTVLAAGLAAGLDTTTVLAAGFAAGLAAGLAGAGRALSF